MKDFGEFSMAALAVIGGIVILALIACLSAVIVWISWNAVIPEVFGLQALTFAQAIWLSVLASTLFKGSTLTKSDIKSAIKEALGR